MGIVIGLCVAFFFIYIGTFLIGSTYYSYKNEQKRKEVARRNGKS